MGAVGTATVLTWPLLYLRQKFNVSLVMMIGAVCFMFVAVMSYALEPGALRHVMWLIYIVYGCGRAVWESTNKAVFAEFFPDDPQAAFANIVLQSGTASAAAFFIFSIPAVTGTVKEMTLL